MSRTSSSTNSSFRRGIFFSQDPQKPPTIRFWCKICHESAARQGDFERHMKRHSGTYEFMCDQSGCRQVGGGVGFHQKRNFLNHIQSTHSPKNGCRCPHMWMNKDGTIEDCAARYETNSQLLKHRKQAHGFKSGDDSSMIFVPTVEGTVFQSHHGDSRRGRSGNSAGAIIYFPEACRNDTSAAMEFAEYVFSNPQQLAESLAQLNVPYPLHILPFSWPKSSRRDKQTAVRSSSGSTPSPEWCAQIALSFAGRAPADPLPYPLTTNPRALATSSSASNHGGQYNQPYNPRLPALAPFFTNPSAPVSPVRPDPPPQPAPTQRMPTPGTWTAPPHATNSVFSGVDFAVVPTPGDGPPALAFTGTADGDAFKATLPVTTSACSVGVSPSSSPARDLATTSSISPTRNVGVAPSTSHAHDADFAPSISPACDIVLAPSSSPDHFYDACSDTLPDEADDMSLDESELESAPSPAELDDKFFDELLSKLPGRDEFAECVWTSLAQAPSAQ